MSAYDWTLAGYVNITGATTDFPSEAGYQLYEFNIDNVTNNFRRTADGEFQIAITHVSSGAIGHYFYYDYVHLSIA